jgi:RNase P/RNase MRP subunit p29
MSERSRTADAATGRRARRPALRLWALALLAVVWAGAAGAVRADEIVLQSGELIEGTIVDATRNTVVIRRAIGGMRQMRIRDIEEVRVDLVQGGRISGQILSWVDGVHQVRSGGEVVSIRDGRVLSRAPHEETGGRPPAAEAPLRQAEPTVGRAAVPAVSERPAAESPAPEGPADESPAAESPAVESPDTERPAAETTAEETTADESPAVASPAPESPAESSTAERPDTETTADEATAAPKARNGTEAVAVKASVDLAEAGAAGVVFRIELSRPAEKTVVLIYGTVDGTAKAGEDYEPRQGVLTLAPGTRSADVRVPLIEHRRLKGDTRFELFLTADPKVATIVDQRVTATIPGDG